MTSPTWRVTLPVPPTDRAPQRLPGWAAVIPGVLSVVALVMSGVVPALLVAAVVPALWVTQGATAQLVGSRRQRRELDRFESELASAEAALLSCQTAERRELEAHFPRSSAAGASGRAATTGVLVLGRGRVASSVVVDGAEAQADPRATDRLRAVRRRAQTLDHGPLCVSASTPVLVIGPGVVARSVAAGLRRQLRGGTADPASLVRVTETVPRPAPPVGVVIVVRPDGTASVTSRDGVACDVALDVSFVSLADEA
ncbi:hypothetical protein ACPEEZ_08935 [Frigoribacterium sp. 2-23]|uniref:hypothetical protein n=1 Tax=Frigoribacterium sp. 2-23 TaxID=3415006 RepID=UPI003C6FCC1A